VLALQRFRVIVHFEGFRVSDKVEREGEGLKRRQIANLSITFCQDGHIISLTDFSEINNSRTELITQYSSDILFVLLTVLHTRET
jgi:hypothetical protein